jgi:hypothetical protein
MKMVKSLLLGSAAGFVAVVGAQAADMPVKAKPVEYVKICSLYGDGFYYIPGSDTCIRVGGYIRASYAFGSARAAQTPIYTGGSGGQRDITTDEYSSRHRFRLEVDTRTQTVYGTLRTLAQINIQDENQGAVGVDLSRALIQWAGFTFGHSDSFADQFDVGDSWRYGQTQNHASTSANGINQLDYALQIGGGWRLHLGVNERSRNKSLVNLSSATAIIVGAEPTSSRAGQRWPDLYTALKYSSDSVEGGVSFMLHDNRTTYFTGGAGCPAGAQVGTSQCGYADKTGWAFLSGIEVKLPFITPGDRAGVFFNYAQGFGAVGGGNNLNSPMLMGTGNELAFAQISDGVFINGSGLELTTTWTVGGAYEHYWSPILKSSFYGTYTQVSYNSTATTYLCGGGGAAVQTNATFANCSPDWRLWLVGSRLAWEPVRRLVLGIDIFWQQVETAYSGAGSINNRTPNSVGARPTGAYVFNNQGSGAAVFRAQRNY